MVAFPCSDAASGLSQLHPLQLHSPQQGSPCLMGSSSAEQEGPGADALWIGHAPWMPYYSSSRTISQSISLCKRRQRKLTCLDAAPDPATPVPCNCTLPLAKAAPCYECGAVPRVTQAGAAAQLAQGVLGVVVGTGQRPASSVCFQEKA